MPRDGQIQNVLVFSDIHDEHIDLEAFLSFKRLFEKTPKKRRKIFLLGDIVDFPEFYKKNEDFKRAKLEKDFDGYFVPAAHRAYEWLEWLLSELRPLVYDWSDIYFFEGNHEERIRRYDFTSFMLAEYAHNFDFPKMMKFEERGIHYIPYNDWLRIKTGIGNLDLTHGVYCGANPIKKHVDVAHNSVMFGHTHERSMKSFKTTDGIIMGFNNPCLCDTSPSYLENKPTNAHKK